MIHTVTKETQMGRDVLEKLLWKHLGWRVIC
jgi:hypothetical protein